MAPNVSLQPIHSSVSPEVALRDEGSGVFSIRIADGAGANTLSPDLVGSLMAALDDARRTASLKVLVLDGGGSGFAHGARTACNEALAQGLYEALVSFPCPVIGALGGGATGAGFLVGALCDFMVCGEAAIYRYTDPEAGLFPTAQEDRLFAARFGRVRAADFLYASGGATGQQLGDRQWSCRVVADGQVGASARALAASLAKKPQDSLRLLKQHLARPLQALVQDLMHSAVPPIHAAEQAQPVQVAVPGKHIRVESHAGKVMLVGIRTTRKKYDTPALAADLATLFDQLRERPGCRAIVLASDYPGFLPEGEDKAPDDAVLALQRALLDAPVPVVAAMGARAGGKAWLMAQSCDAAVYAADGAYAGADLLHSPTLAGVAACTFAHRLGDAAARTILLTGAVHSGADLRQCAGPVTLAPRNQVVRAALRLAQSWSGWPAVALLAWKEQVSHALRQRIDSLPAPAPVPGEAEEATIEAPTPIALASSVIAATAHPGGIVEVTMQDRASKNMFSEALIQGLGEVFAHIDGNAGYKAVILAGYEQYFATGGTREALLAIQQGKLKFTDDRTFRLALDCRIPVIAAMQGHAIGAGLSLGLLADLPLLSGESKYLSPYMNYGFTPGVGATLAVPERLGHDLARESLFTAQEYGGAELKERGIALPVFARKEVHQAAWRLAHALAAHPRWALVEMKRHLARPIRERLDETCERELAMHDLTFVGRADTLKQIETAFQPASVPAPEPEAQQENMPASLQRPHPTDLPEVVDAIRRLLAQELHLDDGELDEHTQLTDLGLDSITGVTWMRKVNQRYALSLDATIVYAHPTLSRLARHIKEQLEDPATAGGPDFAEREAAKIGRREAQHDKPVAAAVSLDAPMMAPVASLASVATVAPAVAAGAAGEPPAHYVAVIRQLLARELHLAEDDLDENTQFTDLGLDSITGVTWMRRVNETYGLSLDATIVYSHPTLNKLGRHVKEVAEQRDTAGGMPDLAELETRKLGKREPLQQPVLAVPARALEPAEGAAAPAPLRELVSWRGRQQAATNPPQQAAPDLRPQAGPDGRPEAAATGAGAPQPIAVIGMAGQFPMAADLDAYWRNIAEGRNCISEVPPSRWDLQTWFQEGEPAEGKTNSKWLGLLDGHEHFDPLFFNISPAEAKAMDPQQRLFLQACWHGIEHAGYNPKSLAGSQCGVFVGAAANDYGLLSRKVQLSAQGFTGNATSILSARIAYFLDLQGPCLAIDTACSSSLVAIAAACDSLAFGGSELALAGGVYVGAGPAMHIMTAQSGMLSADGKCHTFDQQANGFVPGEAVGVVVLKRLADAERDGDIIHAVIRGWGVNQDGRTNGITAPNPESQARLLKDVYRRHRIDPAEIQLVEAHGTGTPLGDPIEVEGLKKSFRALTARSGYCALGSVKSNIGHCLTAAGVTSFIKAVLALQHKQLPPTIHFERLNEHIKLDGSPFYVNDRLRDWTLDGASCRHAAISSFGYSGTNAHVVVAEYAAPSSVSAAAPSTGSGAAFLVPLSAKTGEQLGQRARDLLDFIRQPGRPIDLARLAYTLQVGREAMDERLGLLVASIEELDAGLQAWVDGRKDVAGAFYGQVRLNREGISVISQDDELKETIIDNWIAQRKFGKLLKLWTRGLELDWNRLYPAARPQRMVLPTYPFAKERYWIDEADRADGAEGAATARLHPLVHRNISTLSRQAYASVFATSASQETLMEMARAAVALAAPEQQGLDVALHEVVWAHAAEVPAGADITVVLSALENGRVGFEIVSAGVVCCSGEAAFAARPAADAAAEQLFFEETWCEAPAPAVAAPQAGHAVKVLVLGPVPADMSAADVSVSDAAGAEAADIQALIERASGDERLPVSVICTWARGRGAEGVHALFELFKALKKLGARGDLVSDVLLVGHYDPARLDGAWDYSWIGFERSLKLVLPDLKIALLYTDTPEASAAQLADARLSGGIVWYRGGKRHVLAIRPAEADRERQAPALKQGGAYLITGGCGALGMQFARHLAQHCQARLVLLGRRAPTPAIERQLESLRQAGAAQVHYAALDVGDEDAVNAWARQLALPLSGVFHAAGVEAARPFHEKERADIDAVLRPKTAGTMLLDTALAAHPLDFVCYFSSSAAVLGDFGACDYAIANRFQIGYGQYRAQHGSMPGKTVVINWPFWQRDAALGGMGSDDPEQVAFYLKSSGQQALQPDEGIDICHSLLRADRVQTLVLIGQRTRVAQFLDRVYGRGLPAAVLPAALPAPLAAVAPAAAPAAGLALEERLRQDLRQLVASALQIELSRLDDRANLAEYGFDSISLAALAKLMSRQLSLDVTPALFFHHSTVQQLVAHFAGEHRQHLEQRLGRPQPQPQVAAPVPVPAMPVAHAGQRFVPTAGASARAREAIAVVGMSGRFPQAGDVDQFWKLLEEGRSGIGEVPLSRWDWRDYFTAPGHIGNVISTNKGGFIDGVEHFDPLFFDISPAEAQEMDPSERLLLMEAYRAIEDASISPGALRGTNTGVFVGMEESQFNLVADVQGVTTAGAAMISSRLSYFLDLHGPAIATNTACSSGLVALHQAVVSLRQGECEAALVAGLALNLSPKAWIKMSEARMISQDGQCHSFARQANGIGIGEAVVVLMLKPLSAALASGDHVYGTIKASGINFDGKTNGVTAPSGRAQAQLIERVYTENRIDVRDVAHIVAHGTGTRLGDPVEVIALDEAYKKLSGRHAGDGRPAPRCALTSSKTNVGHTLAASGLVSLVGLLKGMEHHKIPGSLHCEEGNEYIDWRASHFYVNKATSYWRADTGKPRLGAVSAFGRSGTNAHVVVEEHPRPAGPGPQPVLPGNAAVIVPLSARAAPQLRQKARDLAGFLKRPDPVDLAALAYTLQVGREAMEERLAFVVCSVDQLAQALDAWLTGEQQGATAFQGTVGYGKSGAHVPDQAGPMPGAVEKLVDETRYPELAELWTNGVELDWNRLYGSARNRPQRIGLPTYPFARERYWIDSEEPEEYSEPQQGRADGSGGLESIEAIIERVSDGTLEQHKAAAFLKKMAM